MSQKTTKRKPSGAGGEDGGRSAAATVTGGRAKGGGAGAGDGAAEAAPAASPRRGSGGGPPLRLTAASAVAGLEGLAVAAWGVTMFFAGGSKDVLAGFLVLALAALPLLASYGLRRARRWSRGPALIMQLISLPIAWTMLHSDGGGIVAAGAVLGVLAIAGLVLLVHPATTDALGINRTAA